MKLIETKLRVILRKRVPFHPGKRGARFEISAAHVEFERPDDIRDFPHYSS
jgi:hypothetical protein